jgi:Zn-dependent alcohol dehydrogenase
VLIRVEATAVNYADSIMVAGRYQTKPPLPFSPGLETAGVVAVCGRERFEAGRSGNGDSLPWRSRRIAAIRWQGRLEAGETLLVLGAAGGVGLAAVEIRKAMGARVIAAASTPEKLAVAVEHGADATVDYSTYQLTDRVMALTAAVPMSVSTRLAVRCSTRHCRRWDGAGAFCWSALSPACRKFRRTGFWSSTALLWVRRCATSAGTRRRSSAARWTSCSAGTAKAG